MMNFLRQELSAVQAGDAWRSLICDYVPAARTWPASLELGIANTGCEGGAVFGAFYKLVRHAQRPKERTTRTPDTERGRVKSVVGMTFSPRKATRRQQVSYEATDNTASYTSAGASRGVAHDYIQRGLSRGQCGKKCTSCSKLCPSDADTREAPRTRQGQRQSANHLLRAPPPHPPS